MQYSCFLVPKGSGDELDGQGTATSSDVGPSPSCSLTLVAPVSLQLRLHGDPKIAQPSHSPSLLPVPFSYLIQQFKELYPWRQALPTWKCQLRSLRIFFPGRDHLVKRENKILLIRKNNIDHGCQLSSSASPLAQLRHQVPRVPGCHSYKFNISVSATVCLLS